MQLDILLVRNAIKEAFEDEAVTGGDFEGFKVYIEQDAKERKFYPCIAVYTPTTTMIDRFVGGIRTMQLSFNVDIFFTDKQKKNVDGVIYSRDDLSKVLAEIGEELLDDIVFPSSIIINDVPTVKSMTTPFRQGNNVIYQITLLYVADYVEGD